MRFFSRQPAMTSADDALPGRPDPITNPPAHYVNGRALTPPYPVGFEIADLALGCFWGPEKDFWKMPGVWVTAVGYAGGYTPNPTYQEACSGRTGHAETVRVVFDPSQTSYDQILKAFWEDHDPTQGMRQGNDFGSQYRSAIFTHGDAQLAAATASRDLFQERLTAAGYGEITTEIAPARDFFFAEDYHQQYLAKNPGGYCPNHSTGIGLPDDFVVSPLQYVE